MDSCEQLKNNFFLLLFYIKIAYFVRERIELFVGIYLSMKSRGGSRGPQGTPLRTYGNINYRYFKIMIDNLHISVIFGFTQNILACLFSI